MRTKPDQKLGVVGQRGQITLDSQLAGRSVRITKLEAGRYIVEEMSLVPRNEAWAHTPRNRKKIEKGIKSLKNLNKKPITNAAELDLFLENVK